MIQLRLQISGGRITGSGTDIVVPFTIAGMIMKGGVVAMIKQYLGKHQVEYAGLYDGEGALFGEWRIGPFKDRWLISFKRPKRGAEADSEDVQMIA
jgi:hypothetical protein